MTYFAMANINTKTCTLKKNAYLPIQNGFHRVGLLWNICQYVPLDKETWYKIKANGKMTVGECYYIPHDCRVVKSNDPDLKAYV